jgi:hypothetical protein
MNRKTLAIFSLGLSISLLGAGCGQTTEQTGQTAKPPVAGKAYDPCALLTLDDVKAFYPDEPITIKDDQAKQANAVGQRICFFDIGDDMKFVQLSIITTAEMSSGMRASGQDAATLYAQEKELLEAKDLRDVQGLGDAAYYGGSGLGLGRGLSVLKNSKGIKFNVNIGLGFGNADEQRHLDIEKALAKKVLERL